MKRINTITLASTLFASSLAFAADTRQTDLDTVKAEYANIGLGSGPVKILKNTLPDAQWFADAGLGLFIHWGIGSAMPSEYFAQAKEFNPQSFHPETWMKAPRDAGFTYAVLTTKHYEGFALWPSAYVDKKVIIQLPVARRSSGVDVVNVDL